MKRALVAVLAVLACTSTPTATRSTPTPAPSSPAPRATATPPHPVSLQTLMAKRYDGRGLRLVRVIRRTGAYTAHYATYRSGSLTISGWLNVPTGRGPFPALVLNHGYIDPAAYQNGQGMRREQDYLARRGFIVLHTDYRNHAGSSKDPRAALKIRLGYVEDSINAVHALRASSLPVDDERIGMLGRSMGGGVTLAAAVAQPGLVDAFVVWASVSSDNVDNFNKWTRPRRALAERITDAYGSPQKSPEFWRNVSPRTFFDRVTEPVLVHHGTADTICPIAWSEHTVAALRAQDKRVLFYRYPGEPHAFVDLWELSMRRTVTFLRENLR